MYGQRANYRLNCKSWYSPILIVGHRKERYIMKRMKANLLLRTLLIGAMISPLIVSTQAAGTTFGTGTVASGTDSVAMGNQTTASGSNSMSTGFSTKATGESSVATGQTTTASGRASTSMGTNTKAEGDSATAMGIGTTASGKASTSMGATTKATGEYSTAMGYITAASGNNSTALGDNTVASGVSSTAMGTRTTASGTRSTAMGYSTRATGTGSTAMGGETLASGLYSTAMGYQSKAIGENSLAASGGTAKADNSLAFGIGAIAGSADRAKENAIAIGTGAQATANNTVSLGTSSTVSAANSHSYGNNNTIAQQNTFVLGNNVTTTQANSVVLGNGSVDRAATAESSANVNGLTYSGFAGQGSAANGVVSIGKVGAERQLINVAAGKVAADSTDAINGSQLYTVANTVGNVANSTVEVLGGDAAVDADGNITMSDIGGTGKNTVHDAIKAAYDKEESVVAGSTNVTVNQTGTNTTGGKEYKVDIASDLNLNSVTTGDSKLTTDGLTIVGGPSVTKTGIDAGGKKITNVADGDFSANSKDAINGSQLFSAVDTLRTYATYKGGDNVNVINNADGTHTINATNTVTTLTSNDANILVNDTGVNGNHDYKIALNPQLTDQIKNNTSAINRIGQDITRVGAMSAALSGLHPLTYDPGDKLNLAISGGFYKNEQALALGAFYHPNENTVFSVATTVGNSDNMVNVGASFKLGRVDNDRQVREKYKTAPISAIYVLEDKINKQQEEIAELKALVNSLLAKQ